MWSKQWSLDDKFYYISFCIKTFIVTSIHLFGESKNQYWDIIDFCKINTLDIINGPDRISHQNSGRDFLLPLFHSPGHIFFFLCDKG